MDTEGFRQYLQNELIGRCKSNPKYSLRAFARVLQIEPSYLSKILRGERALTKKKIAFISEKLGLTPLMVPVSATALAYLPIDEDRMQILSNGIHYSILELMNVRKFEPNYAWIAKALGTKTVEVQAAVERMVRLGMIEKLADGSWKNTSGNNTTIGSKIPSGILKNFQKQKLEHAIQALDEIPEDERDQGAITFSIPTSMLPQAKEKIRQFRREMDAFFQSTGIPHDEVYQFTTSLTPLTQIRRRKK